MSRIVAILNDVHGVPRRWFAFRKAMEAVGVEALCIAPEEKPKPYALPAVIRPEWLPTKTKAPDGQLNWWRGHMHFADAIASYCPDADFIWCVEGDTWAAGPTWRRLIRRTSDDTSDGLFTWLQYRGMHHNRWWDHPSTPDWGKYYALHALFRLSGRAARWLHEEGEETREVFCEIHVASSVARHGGKIRGINRHGTPPLLMPGSVVAPPAVCKPDWQLICHPVKEDKAPFAIPEDNLDVPDEVCFF